MTKGGYSGTLGAQSALTLLTAQVLRGGAVARAERGLAGQLVVGTKGTESSPGLSVARELECLSAPMPSGRE